jgi:adenylosuccinate synthase
VTSSDQPFCLMVLISGAIASGKSAVGVGLERVFGARVLSSRAIIMDVFPNAEQSRRELQELGARLEKDTGGDWLAAAVATAASSDSMCVVDSVRTRQQVSKIRQLVPPAIHVHIAASDAVRRQRFEDRRAMRSEPSTFEEAASHPIEAEVDGLAEIADLVVHSTQLTAEQTLQVVIESLADKLGG